MSAETGMHDESAISQEKEKARRLRATRWWMQRIAPGICHYCGARVGREALTMDHIVPLSRGGRSTKGNLVPACKACNNRKKYLLPMEWTEYMESLSRRRPDPR
jgi:5-methylcytosine-specific restriction endonuclease McrA